jgi:hypothetical protein
MTTNDRMFCAAIGKHIEGINFARLPTSAPRMQIKIHLAGAYFVIDDCNPITNAEVDAVVGSAITSVTVEINDDEARHWLPARLTIVNGKGALYLVTHAPIFYMDEDTRVFNRFPVPARLEDDRHGFHNPFGG